MNLIIWFILSYIFNLSQFRDQVHRLSLRFIDNFRVNLSCLDRGMAQQLRHRVYVGAVIQEQRSVCVPACVEGYLLCDTGCAYPFVQVVIDNGTVTKRENLVLEPVYSFLRKPLHGVV